MTPILLFAAIIQSSPAGAKTHMPAFDSRRIAEATDLALSSAKNMRELALRLPLSKERRTELDGYLTKNKLEEMPAPKVLKRKDSLLILHTGAASELRLDYSAIQNGKLSVNGKIVQVTAKKSMGTIAHEIEKVLGSGGSARPSWAFLENNAYADAPAADPGAAGAVAATAVAGQEQAEKCWNYEGKRIPARRAISDICAYHSLEEYEAWYSGFATKGLKDWMSAGGGVIAAGFHHLECDAKKRPHIISGNTFLGIGDQLGEYGVEPLYSLQYSSDGRIKYTSTGPIKCTMILEDEKVEEASKGCPHKPGDENWDRDYPAIPYDLAKDCCLRAGCPEAINRGSDQAAAQVRAEWEKHKNAPGPVKNTPDDLGKDFKPDVHEETWAR